MPMVISVVTGFNYSCKTYELTESTEDEEAKNEKEIEKCELDEIDGCLLHYRYKFAAELAFNYEYLIKLSKFANISQDVLTPPPEHS